MGDVILGIDFSRHRETGSLMTAEVILLPQRSEPNWRETLFQGYADGILSTGVHVLGIPSLHESSLNNSIEYPADCERKD